jgi:hypothetical protein
VALSLDLTIAPPFLRQSWSGNVVLSGHLYVDPARSAVYMAAPRVDRFTIDGIDEARQRQLAQGASVLMGQIAHDIPVYSFRMEDLRYAGVQFVPTRITTGPGKLVVAVEPVK